MNERTVAVKNITCGHCTKTIERELGELDGVRRVEAARDGTVRVEIDERGTPWQEVEQLLREIGYPPVA